MKNRVGLGTFPLAGVFSKITKAEAKDVVRKFINEGGYYIDTAPMYGFGKVEKLLGEVLRGFPRNSFFLITKCGYKDVEEKTFQTIPRGATYNDLIRECEISLISETMQALYKLREQGKIKEIGVSNVNLKELKEYNKDGKIRYVQNRFSLINRSIDFQFQKYLLDNQIGLIPYQVIDRGQLTGSIIEGIKLRDGDLRSGRLEWTTKKCELIADWSKNNLLPIAKKLGVTLGQLSIAWALHQPYLSFVIVGLTNSKYVPINLKANNLVLDKDIIKDIDRAYVILEESIKENYGQTLREFRGLNEKFY